MKQLPRRTIDDLLARYELEPSLNDIYVEGEFDKEVLDRLITSHDESLVVYEIATVEVPSGLVASHGLSCGNKQRVITLARELASFKLKCEYRCLVDRDLDHWFGPLEFTPQLTWTEHTCIELYFLSEAFLKDILLVTAKCSITNWPSFYDSLISTLRQQYAIRLTDREMSLNLSWPSINKSLECTNGSVSFDTYGFIKKLINANGLMKREREFVENFDHWLPSLNGDPRSYIRGHDLVTLLAWCVGSFKGLKNYKSEDAIARLFVLLSHFAIEILTTIKGPKEL